MRIKFLLSLAALTPMAMMAETLSPEAALQRALADTSMRKVSPTMRQELLYTEFEAKTSTPVAYVYSRGEEGFMIVSADDIAAPVLGYSDDNDFDANNIPDNMRAWLGFYADEIAWARENGASVYTPQKSTRADRSPIAPMITTTWSQEAPYNGMCPKVGTKQTVTGCVATAMAQIMNYHRYPTAAGSGKASVSVSGTTYTMDFSQTVFDWNNMLNSYSGSSTQAQKDAVALLMKACGYSVGMNYTTSASGAVQAKVAGALIYNFGYDKGVTDVQRGCYTTSDWNDLIYAQLAKKQPVQYGGQSSAGGHSFVCDGYSQNNYFHINWGWGGMSDGYFLLSALDPESQGTGGSGNGSGFDSDQDVVINITKPCGTAEVTPALYGTAFSITAKSAAFSSQLSAAVTGLGNNSPVSPLNAMLGLAFVNKATGQRVICTSSATVSNLSTGSYYQSAITITATTRSKADMPAGEYDIVPVFSLGTGSDATYVWREIPIFVGSNKYTATVTANGITINTLASKIATTDIVPETLYQGVASKISVTISNTGSVPYVGTIKARLRKSNTTTLACNGSNMNIELAPNSTATFDYYLTVPKSVAAGTYNLVFLDAAGNIITSPAKMGVTVATPPTLELTFGQLKVVGSTTDVDPRNVQFSLGLTCTSFKYEGTFTMYFFPYVSGTVQSIGTLTSQPVSIVAGETKTVMFSGDVPALEYGKKYFCDVQYNGAWIDRQVVFQTKPEASGIEDVTTDAEVVSEVYYNMQGVQVAAPAAGLYVKVTGYADGTTKSERVYLK